MPFEAVHEMMLEGGDQIETAMYECWAECMDEFRSPIADAACMLNPQWVNKSRDTSIFMMKTF